MCNIEGSTKRSYNYNGYEL